MDNQQIILIVVGVLTFIAIGWMIWSQSREDPNQGGQSDDVSGQGEVEESDVSDSYYDDSEVYSD